MSEDKPNASSPADESSAPESSKASAQSKSGRPTIPSAKSSEDVSTKLLAIAKQTWTKAEPLLKEYGTKALLAANRGTEYFLDTVLPPLIQKAIAAIPTEAKNKFNAQIEKIQPTLTKLKPIWDKGVVPLWQKGITPTWSKGLTLLRQRLPENLAALTNRFLTLGIIGLVFFVFWFFSALTPDRSVAQSQPAKTPVAKTRPARPVQPVSPPKAAPVIKPSPAPAPVKIAPKEMPAPAAPPSASPVATPVAPKPEIDLAEIQGQLESAIARMGDGIITTVKAPERFQRLQVNLSQDWYSLPKSEQDQLAKAMAQQSQKLKFRTFEFRDEQQTLLARSPVVGNEVIILRRSTP
jgi:hypothetical protein